MPKSLRQDPKEGTFSYMSYIKGIKTMQKFYRVFVFDHKRVAGSRHNFMKNLGAHIILPNVKCKNLELRVSSTARLDVVPKRGSTVTGDVFRVPAEHYREVIGDSFGNQISVLEANGMRVIVPVSYPFEPDGPSYIVPGGSIFPLEQLFKLINTPDITVKQLPLRNP